MFQRFKGMSFFMVLCTLFGLTGCIKHPSYTKRSLKPLTKETSDFVQTKKNVTLMAKKLMPEECTEIFDGRNVNYDSVRPVLLTFINAGSADWVLFPENISLPVASKKMVAEMLHFNMRDLWIGFGCTEGTLLGISSLSFLALMSKHYSYDVAMCYGVLTYGFLAIAVFTAGVIYVPLFITQYLRNRKANDIIDEDVQEKLLGNQCVISHDKSLSKILFTPAKAYIPGFALTLTGNNQEKLTFDVDLDQKANLGKE